MSKIEQLKVALEAANALGCEDIAGRITAINHEHKRIGYLSRCCNASAIVCIPS